MGSIKFKASALQVPADEIPRAKQAPYLTWGLKEAESKWTILGT